MGKESKPLSNGAHGDDSNAIPSLMRTAFGFARCCKPPPQFRGAGSKAKTQMMIIFVLVPLVLIALAASGGWSTSVR